MATPHGIDEAWHYVRVLLESYGWRILGLSVVVSVLYRQYSAYATRAHVQRTLREANDPERVAVLRREAARVREQQQQQLHETLPRPKSKRKSKPL